MREPVYSVEFYLAGGQVIEVEANDLKVGVVPEFDEEGNPNPNVGTLTGFELKSTEEEKLSYLYVKVTEVDAIKATEIKPGDDNAKREE